MVSLLILTIDIPSAAVFEPLSKLSRNITPVNTWLSTVVAESSFVIISASPLTS